MDNKEKKVLEEAGLLYPTPNCVEYYQIVKATADEVVQRIFETMSDSVQVVRCKNCKYYIADGCDECQLMSAKSIIASINDKRWYSDFYCAWGEREDETD